jgi:hypothetical protein
LKTLLLNERDMRSSRSEHEKSPLSKCIYWLPIDELTCKLKFDRNLMMFCRWRQAYRPL